MALKLKRSFKIDKDDERFTALCKTHAEIFVHQTVMSQAKQDLVKSVSSRNQLMREVLLDDHGYVIHSDDKIVFFEQTGEIRVMQEVPENTGYEESTQP